ncbi:aryl-sulfate sulfotransferase, partial [candidate division KSB1 bacterium]|nr:aryl-sulfate sulfotransferase [candidate division KSB1 bacterium]
MKKLVFYSLLILNVCAFAGPYHQAIDYIFPLPSSKLLPVKTTVILKLAESYNDLITDLSDLIVVKDEGVVRGGNTFFATDNRTIIFKPYNDFQRGKTITVTVQLSQFGFENFQYNFTIAKSSDNDLDWLNKTNLKAGSSTNEVQNFSPVRLINGVAVPSDFPEIHVNILGETAPGRLFIPANKWIIICDNDGTPYFYRKYEDGHEKMRFEAHPSGVLSFHSYEVFDVILDQNYVEIDTLYPGHGYGPDDHELQILENGHMLLVARDQVRIDMSKIVSGGNSNAVVEAHHVQELDQDHNVIFEWRNWDHLDIRESKVSLRGGFVDFVHTNSIAVDYDGHLVISPREYNMIMKIDRITGETIWILGGENSDFAFVNENLEFS